ncbi:MAG TPA: M23 family metallopeptidase [candidate division WOR-3 bacterium]|uniref:M23 family metallopeptidase n=1 Tax=candidate division WOR-3 bacterium TaxID=2052148 RepID=A0A9C9EKN6_UNCW3|nr:M23 family metallopeptidase [candidate division WOR-3 bacterium]
MATITLLILFSTYPWPIRPFGSAHPVSATLGDARGSVAAPRFHWGIDIPADSGTKVYSITSTDSAICGGVRPNTYVRVGDYCYIHIDTLVSTGDSVLGILDTINTPPDTIGKVLDYPNGDHLHFQVGPAGGPYENPLSHNGGPVGYDDTGNPTVSIDFWRQGSEGDTAQQLVGVLDGKVDIRACCQDTQTSGGVNNTSGVYKLEWSVRDTITSDTVGPIQTIIFPQVQPPNNGDPVLLVYDRHNYRTASPFYYWATNRIVNNQVEDRYWNTKQKLGQPDSVDADSIEDAKFPDGFFYVKVLAYDISDNADSESVLVHIDNFAPRVKQTYPSDWFAFVPTKQHKIWCCFSEAMDTTTLTAENIKIQSLKSDSFNYIITNINYIQADTLDTFTLYLEVDSFRYLNCC